MAQSMNLAPSVNIRHILHIACKLISPHCEH
jgi:hypothetical protein